MLTEHLSLGGTGGDLGPLQPTPPLSPAHSRSSENGIRKDWEIASTLGTPVFVRPLLALYFPNVTQAPTPCERDTHTVSAGPAHDARAAGEKESKDSHKLSTFHGDHPIKPNR